MDSTDVGIDVRLVFDRQAKEAEDPVGPFIASVVEPVNPGPNLGDGLRAREQVEPLPRQLLGLDLFRDFTDGEGDTEDRPLSEAVSGNTLN